MSKHHKNKQEAHGNQTVYDSQLFLLNNFKERLAKQTPLIPSHHHLVVLTVQPSMRWREKSV